MGENAHLQAATMPPAFLYILPLILLQNTISIHYMVFLHLVVLLFLFLEGSCMQCSLLNFCGVRQRSPEELNHVGSLV